MAEAEEITWLGALMTLSDLGFVSVVVDYSGGGDSGAVDYITYMFKDEEDAPDRDICEKRAELVPKPVREFLDSKIDKVLGEIEDWWNNDGGSGKLTIQIPSGEYEIENNINITNTETYNHNGSFGEQEGD